MKTAIRIWIDMAAHSASSTISWRETGVVLDGTDEFATLEAVVSRHGRFVFKVAFGVLRNPHDAEDVVQEVFLRVQRSGTKGVADIPAWLARIAYRLALDRLRKPRGLDVADIEMSSNEPDAERMAMHRQRVEHVQRLIGALPEELRYPLVLSAMEELNSRQIAEVLGIPESSVRGRIFRARQMLKEKLSAFTEKRK
jgi:RNA polymerase sigma-70 factor (ECF subfamily)